LPTFTPILYSQPYNTRRAIGHAIVSNILKKETVISTPEEVKGILELCHVLMKDQKDASIGGGMQMRGSMPGQLNAHQGMQGRGMMRGMSGRGSAYDMEEMAEEQGWIARLVHLFRSDEDDVQFKVRSIHSSPFCIFRLSLILYRFLAFTNGSKPICRRRR
jgi:vacuolar protein sorting-associated protein 35